MEACKCRGPPDHHPPDHPPGIPLLSNICSYNGELSKTVRGALYAARCFKKHDSGRIWILDDEAAQVMIRESVKRFLKRENNRKRTSRRSSVERRYYDPNETRKTIELQLQSAPDAISRKRETLLKMMSMLMSTDYGRTTADGASGQLVRGCGHCIGDVEMYRVF
jgi:hypothetical protein